MNKLIARFSKYALLLLLICCMAFSKKEKVSFSFIQMCDTQLGMGGYDHDVKSFQRAVAQINALKPDFVVICGDLVHHAADSSFTDFNAIKKGFSMPCYTAAGNHDVGNVPTDKSLQYYRKMIGKDYYEFNHKGYSFIVTNSQLWKTNVGIESDKHDKWFKKTIQKQNTKKRSIVVVGHYPLFTVSANEDEAYFNLPKPKREELFSLFQQNKVLAYLAGHTHTTMIHNIGNTQLVNGETTSKNFDKKPLGFRLWKVTSEGISHQFIQLKD